MSPVLICTICSSLHKNNYATNSSKCWWSLAQAMLSIFKTQVTMVFDVCIQWFFLFTRSLGSTLSVNVTEVFSKYSMWPLIKYVFVYKATVAPRVFWVYRYMYGLCAWEELKGPHLGWGPCQKKILEFGVSRQA